MADILRFNKKKEINLKVLRDLRVVSVFWLIVNVNISWTLQFTSSEQKTILCWIALLKDSLYTVQWKGGKE